MAAIWFGILAAMLAYVDAADNCTPRGGHCQHDTLHCSGAYHTGLCLGDAHHRCCMPHHVHSPSSCPGVRLVSRAEWGARAPKHAVSHLHNPVNEVFIHHTAEASCHTETECAHEVRGHQRFHMDTRGWNDIGYSFLVGEDGNVYEGRGWDVVGAHTQGYNSVSYAISFMGNFHAHTPKQSALDAAEKWIECGIKEGKITSNYKLFGHRDGGNTECPGNALYALIRTWKHYDIHSTPHH